MEVAHQELKVLAGLYRKALPCALHSYRRYLLFAAVLFATCVFVGYSRSAWAEGDSPWIFRNFERLASAMQGQSQARRVLLIFWNNLKVTLISLGLGWLGGIVPIVSTALNGVLIGGVAKIMVEQEAMPLWVVAVSFVPHGVFEIPAFVAGQAIGLRIGFLVPVVLRKRASVDDLGRAIAEGLTILVSFVVPLLAVAALVELEVSPAVLKMLAPNLTTLPL